MRNWTLVLACLLCIAEPLRATAKSYTVPSVQVTVDVTTDGLLLIEEELSYEFDGSFTFVYRDIPLKGDESVSDISVSEDGQPFRLERGEESGSFQTDQQDSKLRVTWHYRARNEARTFKLKYTMAGVVTRYRDVAELYFQFIGDEWDHAIGEVDVRVNAPESLATSDIRAWVHGPLHGEVEIQSDGGVRFNVAPLPARTFWEGRILYPPGLFPDLPLRDEDARPRIMQAERGWAEEANRQREADRRRMEAESAERTRRRALGARLMPVCVLLGLAAMGTWFLLYRRHGKAHDVQSRISPGDIPSDHPPAVVSYLVASKSVGGSAIVATLLDLANRGHLGIEESVEEKNSLFGRRKHTDYRFHRTEQARDELIPYERDLLDFLLNTAGSGTEFTMSGLKKTASKKRRHFHKWFTRWVKQVKLHAGSFDFYEPYPVGPMFLNAVVGVVIAGFGIWVLATTGAGVGAVPLVFGFVQAVLTLTLTRHTVEGRRLALAWGDFKSHLRRTSKGLGPVSLSSREWGRYVGVAILFGMHKKLLPHLRIADGAGQAAVYPAWFHAAHGSSPGDVAALADGFSSMVTSMSSTVSSASGTGGGASGGGGGGSGGGGGGAG